MDEKCSRCSDKVNLWNETEENGVINHTLIGEYCRLNECKYADLEYDLREIYKKIAEIIREYDDDDLNRSTGFERIKELIEGVTSTHSSTDSSTRSSTISREVIEDLKTEIETELSWYCFDDWGTRQQSGQLSRRFWSDI